MTSIKDVARVAGVGLGTASRVINNKGSVKPETREKVLRVIEELNYSPNEVARNFKSQSTKIIGLLLPSVNHPFFSKISYYIENELYKNDYKLLLCNSDSDKNKELEYIEMLHRHQVAGIILISYSDLPIQENSELPIVTIDRYLSEKIPHISADNYQGGAMATKALIDGGATKLAYMGGEPIFKSSVSDRKHALIDIAREKGIPYIVHESLPRDHPEESLAKEFIELYPDVDGILASTDLYAAALIKALVESGRKVPEDVQVIGFDGIQDNNYFNPILTTIVQPVEEMSRQSVKILLNMIEKKEISYETIVEVAFKQGNTSRK